MNPQLSPENSEHRHREFEDRHYHDDIEFTLTEDREAPVETPSTLRKPSRKIPRRHYFEDD